MCNGNGRVNPTQAILLKWQCAKKGRGQRHWMDRGTDIMHKAWQSQFARTGTTARSIFCLKHQDRVSCLCHDNSRCKAIWTRTYDNGIIRLTRKYPLSLFHISSSK